jgi:hypothetical protein
MRDVHVHLVTSAYLRELHSPCLFTSAHAGVAFKVIFTATKITRRGIGAGWRGGNALGLYQKLNQDTGYDDCGFY